MIKDKVSQGENCYSNSQVDSEELVLYMDVLLNAGRNALPEFIDTLASLGGLGERGFVEISTPFVDEMKELLQ